MFPGREISGFKGVSFIEKTHFAPNTNQLRVVDDDSTAVEGSFVQDRTADINHDTVGDSWSDDVSDDVPGMEDSVVLEEVVLARVAWDFELSSDSNGAVETATLLDALAYFFEVVFEVERVIVETAETDFDV